jgi:hypothetical protein
MEYELNKTPTAFICLARNRILVTMQLETEMLNKLLLPELLHFGCQQK